MGNERELFGPEDGGVVGVIGTHFPEVFWEIAVVGTGEVLIPAGAPLHFGFEVPGGVFADDPGVFAVRGFVMAGQGVGADAGLESGWLDWWIPGWVVGRIRESSPTTKVQCPRC